MDINNCTRCGKELTDLRIDIAQRISVERKQNSITWENLPNLGASSREILCKDCFDEYTSIMEQMNIKKNDRFPGLK